MAVFSRNVVDRNGVPVPGVAVTVRMASGINAGQLAELTDAGGLSLEQPLTTDALGVYTFDAADGLYDVEFRRGGVVVAVDYGLVIGNAAGGGGQPIDEATIIDALGYIPADVDALAAGLAVKANATTVAAKANIADIPGLVTAAGFLSRDTDAVIRAPGAQGTRGGRTIFGMGGTGAITGQVAGTWSWGAGTTDRLRAQVQRRDGSFATPLDIDPITNIAHLLVPPVVDGEALALAGLANVGRARAATISITGPQSATPGIPTFYQQADNGGVGLTHAARLWPFGQINAGVEPNIAGVVALDALYAGVGGNLHNTVVEGRFTLLHYNAASPSCVNANTVCDQTRMIASVDGRVADVNGSPNYMVLFGGSDFVALTPTGNNFSMCGRELVVGSYNRTATLHGRSAISLNVIGTPKAADGFDTFITCAAGPQAMSHQDVNTSGARSVILLTDAYSPAGYGAPLTPTGSILTAKAVNAPWGIKDGIDLSQIGLTGSLVKSDRVDLQRNVAVFSSVDHGLTLGGPTLNTPYMDFKSSGMTTQRDVRFVVTGGSATPDNGFLSINSATVVVKGVIHPAGDNTTALGRPENRFSTVYLGSAPIVSSDRRIKDEAPFDRTLWLRFLRALRPVAYRLKDYTRAAVTETRMIQREKMAPALDADGAPVMDTTYERRGDTLVPISVPRMEPVTERLAVLDADGAQRMTRGCVDTYERMERVEQQDADGNPVLDFDGKPVTVDQLVTRPVMGDVPEYQTVVVMEAVEETVETRPAVDATFARLHLGFIAQEVRDALATAGLDGDPDMTRSVWSLFAYDPDADLYLLRYEQFVVPLLAGWQDLDARLAVLEAAA